MIAMDRPGSQIKRHESPYGTKRTSNSCRAMSAFGGNTRIYPRRNGQKLLDDIANAIRQHVVMSDDARDTAALFALHIYLLDRSLISPRLVIASPTKRCGKTTLIDVLSHLVLKPLGAVNVSSSVIFRVANLCRPTFLIDQADTSFKDNKELCSIMNGGYRQGRSGDVLRGVGEDYEPRAFATYAACVIALIGRLPETLHDRAVVIALKRRTANEPITPFRFDRTAHLDVLARQTARWAKDHAEQIGVSDPDMPEGIFNREADNWRPLLCIADAAGGDWPVRARAALEAAHTADDDESRLAMLLADIKQTFKDEESSRLPSSRLVAILVAIEGRPWAEYRSGKPMTQNQLARALKPLGIAPEVFRYGESTPRGYSLGQFDEAFERYLSPEGGDSNRNNTLLPMLRFQNARSPITTRFVALLRFKRGVRAKRYVFASIAAGGRRTGTQYSRSGSAPTSRLCSTVNAKTPPRPKGPEWPPPPFRPWLALLYRRESEGKRGGPARHEKGLALERLVRRLHRCRGRSHGLSYGRGRRADHRLCGRPADACRGTNGHCACRTGLDRDRRRRVAHRAEMGRRAGRHVPLNERSPVQHSQSWNAAGIFRSARQLWIHNPRPRPNQNRACRTDRLAAQSLQRYGAQWLG